VVRLRRRMPTGAKWIVLVSDGASFVLVLVLGVEEMKIERSVAGFTGLC
jgi:hypothetical protein